MIVLAEKNLEGVMSRLKRLLREAAGAVCPLCGKGDVPLRTEGLGIHCHSTKAGLDPCRAGQIWGMINGGGR